MRTTTRWLSVMLGATAAVLLESAAAFAQVDFSGEWIGRTHEDQPHRGGGADIGDYTGLPINDAARLKADSWHASLLTLPEKQCLPHPAAYVMRGPMAMRIWKVIAPVTQQLIAFQQRGSWMEPERTIWLDGRSHPSEHAARTWQGFSTGEWHGNVLTVTTTHLKQGFIQRNGVAVSDKAVVTDQYVRHGDLLTVITIVQDPVYLTEPFIRSTSWILTPEQQGQRYPCGPNEIVVEVPREKGLIPHHLPGTNNDLQVFAARYGLPYEAARGGPETLYPEYMEKMKTMRPATVPKSSSR